MSERLHKLLAQHGFGSRREIEKWMLEGRIVLNGHAAQPGASYSSGDRVAIDGRDVTSRLKVSAAAPSVLLYHKAQGQPITSAGEDARVRQIGHGIVAVGAGCALARHQHHASRRQRTDAADERRSTGGCAASPCRNDPSRLRRSRARSHAGVRRHGAASRGELRRGDDRVRKHRARGRRGDESLVSRRVASHTSARRRACAVREPQT